MLRNASLDDNQFFSEIFMNRLTKASLPSKATAAQFPLLSFLVHQVAYKQASPLIQTEITLVLLLRFRIAESSQNYFFTTISTNLYN